MRFQLSARPALIFDLHKQTGQNSRNFLLSSDEKKKKKNFSIVIFRVRECRWIEFYDRFKSSSLVKFLETSCSPGQGWNSWTRMEKDCEMKRKCESIEWIVLKAASAALKACNPRNEYTFHNDIIIFVLKSCHGREKLDKICNLIFIITYLSVIYEWDERNSKLIYRDVPI